jgi:hypothetical protein
MHIEYCDGMKLGLGYDSITNQLRHSPFKDQELLDENTYLSEGNAQTTEFQFKILHSKEDFSEALSISASINLSFLNWGGGAKGNFIKCFKSDEEHLYVLNRILIINPYKMKMREKIYTEEAQKIIKTNKDIRRFFNEYGDYYIDGFVGGCEIFSLFELRVSKQEVKNKLSSEISAKFPIKGVEFGTNFSFDSVLENYKGEYSLNVHHYQSGGENIAPSISLENNLEYINQLKESVESGRSSLYAAIMAEHDFSQLSDDTATNYSLSSHNRFYSTIIKYKMRCQDLLNFVDNVLLYPEKPFSKDVIDEKKLKDIQEQRRILDDCLENLSLLSDTKNSNQNKMIITNNIEEARKSREQFNNIKCDCDMAIHKINILLPNLGNKSSPKSGELQTSGGGNIRSSNGMMN